jgi:hypothetical protein
MQLNKAQPLEKEKKLREGPFFEMKVLFRVAAAFRTYSRLPIQVEVP